MLLTLGRVVVALAAAVLAVVAVQSAIRTVVVPRGVPDRFARVVFRVLDAPTAWRAGRASSSGQLDRRTAGLAIRLLLALLVAWLGVVYLAGVGVQWGLAGGSAARAFSASASALTTLGVSSAGSGASAAAYLEAVLGLALLALIIGYLPSIYAAFSRREALVSKLAMRTGLPPAGPAILSRLWCPAAPQTVLSETWQAWEDWFVDVSETHTSFPVLAFFHSPQTDKSWITAAGAMLDAAALALAAVDADWGPEAGMCLHAGIVSLRHVADFHGIPYQRDAADATIAVTEHDVTAACRELTAAGVPVGSDLRTAYERFRRRRAQYDQLLLDLCAYLYAPPAPWSSDKVVAARHRPPIIRVGPGSLGRVYPPPDPSLGAHPRGAPPD
ncbi:MAG TPA: hypothetical protein VEJ42_07335 [Streptosporangiaceae bacterium]|nr:hypothetical protein [Streptosporangiaceae bacterium]